MNVNVLLFVPTLLSKCIIGQDSIWLKNYYLRQIQ